MSRAPKRVAGKTLGEESGSVADVDLRATLLSVLELRFIEVRGQTHRAMLL
jgi:hypothetical protein